MSITIPHASRHDMYPERDDERAKFACRWHTLSPHSEMVLHYKGGLYEVLGRGRHTENSQELVAMRHLWPHITSEWQFRPLESFLDIPEAGCPRYQDVC